ncbi:hypothetical protein T440DRAFT_521391 [Plenodomus tracheiphilus IPT5]|uniref:DRBM domain-containing protein n=1 Tax=Plenodomus tracheiphilus IPT5 TaxID=1408161 RepID=A0A6A7AV72_9PLEO|nr:hypothetical protein T440DRAFT_521391 [Plenodomus tracheiphilus IPT5]
MISPAEDLKRYLIVPSSPLPTGPTSSPSGDPDPSSRPTGLGILRKQLDSTQNVNMEIDTPTQPTLPGAHTVDDPSKHGVFKIEDFLAQHKAEHDASVRAQEAAAKTAKPSQTAEVVPQLPVKEVKTAADVAPMTPVAVGARSSKHTILLHERYQALALPQPTFIYGGGSDLGWTVEVSFPGLNIKELQGLKADGHFNSKQEAKEAASKLALAVLERMQEEGRIKKAEKLKKSGGIAGGEQQREQEKEAKGSGSNYVGQLLEFQRATASPQPTYTDYQSGTRFACLLSIEGHLTPYGSLTSLHSSKKAARQDAAGHAVAHFKALGVWPEYASPVGGIKKKKLNFGLDAHPVVAGTSSPDVISSSASTRTPAGSGASNPKESFSSRAAQLSATLSLSPPEYIDTPNPSEANFHSVSCYFRSGGPHAGPIGEVRNVFGRKKAKEECARLVVEYLEEVKEKRLEYGREMMRGIGGGTIVGEQALGRAVDGEKLIKSKNIEGQSDNDFRGGDKDSVNDEGFEDAMETLPL